MPNNLLSVSLTLFLLVFSANSVLASKFSPKNYYDWTNWPQKGAVLAESTSSEIEVKKTSGMLPDNTFYFLKPLVENITLVLILNPETRESKRIDLAEERLAETQALLEKNNYPLASKNFQRYKSSLESASTSIDKLRTTKRGNVDLTQKLELYSAKHSLILEGLEESAPEEVKSSLKTALETTRKTMDKSADNLGKPPVTNELNTRLQSLQSLGILSPLEVNSLLSLSSREEVRKRVEDLSSQNIFPLADVKKVDDAQLYYFPNEYIKISEQKKLQEFISLESQKPDQDTQKRIANFSKQYKPGDLIPPDIKSWWVLTQRYQELQATLRPELVPTQKENPKTPTALPKQANPTPSVGPTSEQEQSSPVPSPIPSESPIASPTFGSECNFGTHAIGTIFGEGKCYYLRCEQGWYNNDLNVNNGCESNVDAGIVPTPGSEAAGICGSGQVKNDKGVCVSENQTCTDTNQPVPFYTSGTCTDQEGSHPSYCDGSVVKDYLCQGTWDAKTASQKDHRCVTYSFDCASASTVENYACVAGGCVKQ